PVEAEVADAVKVEHEGAEPDLDGREQSTYSGPFACWASRLLSTPIACLLRFRGALREARIEEMDRDDRVFLMGEEVGLCQGAYKVSEGMLEKFGPKRVIDTPIAEAGFAGVGM